MLTLDQCIDMCGLDPNEVELLARRASVPEIIAAQMACGLLQSRAGKAQLDCLLHQRLAEAQECADGCASRATRCRRQTTAENAPGQ